MMSPQSPKASKSLLSLGTSLSSVQLISADNWTSGGLELLFDNERKHEIILPARKEDGNASDISSLLIYLVENTMNDNRKDMFIMEDSVYVNTDAYI